MIAVHPYYVVRTLGGVFFMIGGLIMVYNLIRTVYSPTTELPRVAVGSGYAPDALAVAGE